MKLNLGACDDLRKEFINVDCSVFKQEQRDEFECVTTDLNHYWPWEDSSIDFILAADVIEHLHHPIHTMNEAWRVLKPGAHLEIFVPTTEGRGAFQDPSHRSYWNRNSFFYYEEGNIHRNRFGDSYGIKARFEVLLEREEHLQDNVVKLRILLKAVKPDANSGTDTSSAS